MERSQGNPESVGEVVSDQQGQEGGPVDASLVLPEEGISLEAAPITNTRDGFGKVALGGTIESGKNEGEIAPKSKQRADKDSTRQTGDKQRGTHRGHPMKQVKQHLAEQGKLNAKKPMPDEWRKRRRKKRR